MASFKIERQITTTYVDPKSGDAIRGFEVTATLYPWDEFVRILVPSLDVKVVEPILDELIEQREALDKLSEIPDGE
jgi:hypothetical protein